MLAKSLLAVFVLVLPTVAQAQPTVGESGDLPAIRATGFEIAPAPEIQSPSTRPPSNRGFHCCNKKGALIGLAVGAGLAVWLVHSLCDSADCTSNYVSVVALFGGIGAGIGALANTPNLRGPVGFPVTGRLRVSPAVSRDVAGGIMTVSF